MRTASLLAAVGATALLVACGQKGPLVLPDAQHPRKKLGVPKPAAQTTAPAPARTDAGAATPPAGDNPGGADAAHAPR